MARAPQYSFLLELRTRRLPGSWHLIPVMRPEGLREMLHATGFHDGGEKPGMAADLRAGTHAEPTDLVTSERCRRRGDAGVPGRARCWLQGGTEGSRLGAEASSTIGFDGAWVHFVGRVGTTPVATTSLLLTPPVGGIYFVCTRPEERGRVATAQPSLVMRCPVQLRAVRRTPFSGRRR